MNVTQTDTEDREMKEMREKEEKWKQDRGRDKEEEAAGVEAGGEEQRRERRSRGDEEERAEAGRERDKGGGKGGGSWVDSGKTPRVQVGGRNPAPAPSSMPPPARQAVPQALSVSSKDKMRLVSKESRCAAHVWAPGLL